MISLFNFKRNSENVDRSSRSVWKSKQSSYLCSFSTCREEKNLIYNFSSVPHSSDTTPNSKVTDRGNDRQKVNFFFFGVQQNKEADSCLMGRRRDVMLMGKAATISDTYWHFPFSSHCEGFPQAGARLLANFPWPTTWLDTTISYYRSKLCAASTVNYDRWPN